LSWNSSSSPSVIGYYMYRSSTTGGPYSRVNGPADQGTTGTDASVQSGQTYFYVVTAVDGNGFESAFSNEASAVIP
jgi:fibronectin type 3 domain-containing protein